MLASHQKPRFTQYCREASVDRARAEEIREIPSRLAPQPIRATRVVCRGPLYRH